MSNVSHAADWVSEGRSDNVALAPRISEDWLSLIIGLLIFDVLPNTMAQGGKHNALAYSIARLLGQHVGEEQLRRRARIIQDLLVTAGPLAGIVATAAGSMYAGLKGVFGW